MKNKWTENLKKKILGHEIQPPENLWDDISAEIFGKEDDKKAIIQGFNSNSKTLISILKKWSIAAVLVTIIALSSILFFVNRNSSDLISTSSITQNNPEKHIEKQQERLNSKERKAIQTKNLTDTRDGEKEIIFQTHNFRKYLHAQKPMERHESTSQEHSLSQDDDIEVEKSTIIPILGNRPAIVITPTELVLAEIQIFPREIDGLFFEKEQLKKERDFGNKKIYFGPTMNQLAMNSSAQNPGYTTMRGVSTLSFAMPEVNNPFSSIMLNNTAEEVKTEIRHQAPQTYGFSVLLPLNTRWSLTSALNYSLLKSDLNAGGSANFWKSSQKLHYLGIPLSLNYSFVQAKKFSAYTTTGVQVQKLLSGKSTTTYTIGDETKGSSSFKIHEKPFQFSVNLGLGAEYRLYKNLSVFAEPGIGYYFDNHSSVESVYKEKKMNFNFAAGLRISLLKNE